jgi:hypothetical protein
MQLFVCVKSRVVATFTTFREIAPLFLTVSMIGLVEAPTG